MTTCHLPPVTHHLSLTTCHSPPITHHLSLTTCHSPPITHPPSLTTYHSLIVSHLAITARLLPQLLPVRWRDETGGDRAQLKEYFNSEYPPLLTPTPGATGPTTVLSRIPIPLLHTLLLNPANHILAHLTSVWPPLDNFFGELHVTREDYHGGSFEGTIT